MEQDRRTSVTANKWESVTALLKEPKNNGKWLVVESREAGHVRPQKAKVRKRFLKGDRAYQECGKLRKKGISAYVLFAGPEVDPDTAGFFGESTSPRVR